MAKIFSYSSSFIGFLFSCSSSCVFIFVELDNQDNADEEYDEEYDEDNDEDDDDDDDKDGDEEPWP